MGVSSQGLVLAAVAHALFASTATAALSLHMFIGERLAAAAAAHADPAVELTWYFAAGGVGLCLLLLGAARALMYVRTRVVAVPKHKGNDGPVARRTHRTLDLFPLCSALLWPGVGLYARFSNPQWAEYREWELATAAYGVGNATGAAEVTCVDKPAGQGVPLPPGASSYRLVDPGWHVQYVSPYTAVTHRGKDTFIAAPIVYDGTDFGGSDDPFGCRLRHQKLPHVWAACRVPTPLAGKVLSVAEAYVACNWGGASPGGGVTLRPIAATHTLEASSFPERWTHPTYRTAFMEYNAAPDEAVRAFLDDFLAARKGWRLRVLTVWLALAGVLAAVVWAAALYRDCGTGGSSLHHIEPMKRGDTSRMRRVPTGVKEAGNAAGSDSSSSASPSSLVNTHSALIPEEIATAGTATETSFSASPLSSHSPSTCSHLLSKDRRAHALAGFEAAAASSLAEVAAAAANEALPDAGEPAAASADGIVVVVREGGESPSPPAVLGHVPADLTARLERARESLTLYSAEVDAQVRP
eukprot:TRINITY_DN8100_c0_g2_i1.p2 TRINITY_DN8100_c0_g2~~TRINITY_DN8100_c0_g2_i1.p2  ORF type:complete len:526 (+),score=134.29 TRINITY_DN8100_c0_g2_i1:70-1647(+)